MKKQELFIVLIFLLISLKSSPQSFLITSPKLQFDGTLLQISYDIVDNNRSDQFFVWVEIEKKNGETIIVKTLSGDVGEKINSGTGKKITWIPEKDSVFLDEEVLVEIKAEKYVKSFNKGSAMLMSAALPGLGQTRISKGKPWWVTGVVAYGAIVGGIIAHSNSVDTYESYKGSDVPATREDLYNKAQKQMNTSQMLIISGAVIWAANIIWVALIPDRYQPMQHMNLSLNQSTGPYRGAMLLTFHINF